MTAASDPPRRFLHLWLDRLSIDRTLRAGSFPPHPAGAPLALIAKQASAVRLEATDAVAEGLGLSPGLTLSDARARIPELVTADADPAADLALLERLADACRRYTPALALDAPDSLVLDITGTERLWDGEGAMGADLLGRLEKLGLSGRIGIADTPGAAWAMARFGGAPVAVVPPGKTAAALDPLPIAALRLDADMQLLLKRLGLRRVSQITAQPRAALARRLGEGFLDRLDETLGRRSCALTLRLEAAPYRAERRLWEPVSSEDQVLRLTQFLAARLAERLEGEGLGGRRFLLELCRVDGAVRRLEVATSRPLRDPPRIAALFNERLAGLNEGLEADFGFDHLRLTALETEPCRPQAMDLLETPGGDADLASLADRLAARLGQGAVRRLTPAPDSQVPERAARAAPFAAVAKPAWGQERAPRYGAVMLRPLRLFSPPQPIEVIAEVPEGLPEQFTWRRVARRIAAGEGPERIEPEWARDREAARVRDYYRLEDERGRRYWVFREGRFGEPAGHPRWFLHGLFP